MSKRFFCVSLGVLALAIAGGSAEARTWHILPDGSGDAPTIQAGIDSAAVGDTVLLACGTYYEHGIALASGVCVRSETGAPECATVDGQDLGSVFLAETVDNSASIEGLTIAGGRAASGGGGSNAAVPLQRSGRVYSWATESLNMGQPSGTTDLVIEH